jgi:hypothetical protein
MTDVHIYAPPGHYIGQVRAEGCRTWETVTMDYATLEDALIKASKFFTEKKRIRVLFIDDSGYHEPTLMFEGKRL